MEGRYTPEVIPADRLALLPAAVTLTAPESPMVYDRNGVIAKFAPDALNMPATGWRAKKAYDDSKGYLDFRLGSWLNSSLSAGFNAIRNEDTRLNLYLQHNSTSLWQPWKEDAAISRRAADKRFRYDETIGADLTHKYSGAGSLKATLQYHLGYFNYYGTYYGAAPDSGQEERSDAHIVAPTQTLNDVYARLGWSGESTGKLKYSADADVRHFAYRAMYLPTMIGQYAEYAKSKGERETAINAGGGVTYRLDDNQIKASSIGADLRYSGVINAVGNDVGRVELIPAYTLTARAYTLRIGANLAMVANGVSTRFRAAPDVSFSARKGIATVLASVGGGTHLRTLAWMHTMDYYSNPGYGCYEAAYTPLDVRIAFQLNPGGKWTFGMEWDGRTTTDESFGGLYQAILNGNPDAYGGYPESGKIQGFSISANAGFEFSRFLGLHGKMAFQPQKGKTGFLNGFDRPKVTVDLSAVSSPIERLSLRLDYRLKAKRMLLPGSLSRLDLSGEYRITDKVSVGAQLNNLLNRHEEMLPGLPLEGFNAAAGMQITF